MNKKAKILVCKAKKKTPIEGLSEEMNVIASQNMDFASARRRVRSAFMDVQQQLDHCLFKMAPTGIRMEEVRNDDSATVIRLFVFKLGF